MPQADRLYYDDSFVRTFTARVADIREYARTDGQSLWQIALDRTAFYPTSGGQPFDRGTLTATARSGAELIAEIDEVIEDEDGEVWHSTRKPLLAGTEVAGAIDWQRRLDHMQQHTGQHLLSAVFAQELQAQTVSFHLGETASSIDLAVTGAEEHAAVIAVLEQVELRANQYIAEDRLISLRTVSAEEAQALLAGGALRKLPPRAGSIRLVEMERLDLNACGGTHVRSLGQVGSLLVRGTEKTRNGLRVEFLCGLRAIAASRGDWAALSASASLLSVRREDMPAAVDRLLADARSSAKAHVRLREELARHQAVQLAVEARIDQGLRLVRRTFADRDAGYVKLLASCLVASVPQTVAVFLSTLEEPATLILASSASLQCGCGARLKQALAPLGARGGGSPDMAQAVLPREQAESLAQQLSRQLAEELRQVHA